MSEQQNEHENEGQGADAAASQPDAAAQAAPDAEEAKASNLEANKDSGQPDAGEAEVQQRFDAANAKGFLGVTPDPTPNENYSLQTPPDAPTPETDEELAAAVGSHGRFSGGRVLDHAGKVLAEDVRKLESEVREDL